MPVLRVRGADIYFEEAGRGSAVVLAHGGGGDLSQWRHQVPAFAQHHRVITFDARGHGQTRTAAPIAGFADFTSDLADLLCHLEIQGAHLVGATLGGVTILELALAHPQKARTLTLISTAADSTDEMRARFEASAAVVESGDLDGFAEGFIHFIFSSAFAARHPAEVEEFRARLAAIDPAGYAQSIRALGNRPGLTARLARLRVPALIVTGALDPIPTSAPGAAALATALPDARAEIIPEAAHLPHIEQPETFNRLALDFFAAAERAGSQGLRRAGEAGRHL